MQIEIDGKPLEIDTDSHVIDWDAIDWNNPREPVRAIMKVPKHRRFNMEIRGYNTGNSRVVLLKNLSTKPKEVRSSLPMACTENGCKLWPRQHAMFVARMA